MIRKVGEAYNRVVPDFGGLLIFCEVGWGARKMGHSLTELGPRLLSLTPFEQLDDLFSFVAKKSGRRFAWNG